MKQLREDFELWWLTANFQDKLQLAVVATIIVGTVLNVINVVQGAGQSEQ